MQGLRPGAGYGERMLNGALEAMRLDRLVSARRIRQPVTDHTDIGAAFDAITYQKGGALLSMLEGFVGEETFKLGIQQFIRKHRYGNATARDFVGAIAAVRPDLPKGRIESAFFSFLEQPGTPLVEVSWQCNRDGRTVVEVNQSRYLPHGSRGERRRTWTLPLCIAWGGERNRQQHCRVIDQATSRFDLHTSGCPYYVLPNANASGYYRWSVPEEQWRTLLSMDALNERERLSAADSLNAAFEAGRMQAETYLDLLPLVLQSRNVHVVKAPLRNLQWIDDEVLTAGRRRTFQKWVGELYGPMYQEVRLDRQLDDPDRTRLRPAVVQVLGLLARNAEVRDTLTALAIAYTGYNVDERLHPKVLDPNIRLVALRVAAQELDRDFADLLLKHFHHSRNAVLREELLTAATESSDNEFVRSLRALALSDTIRDNEARMIVQPLMRRPETRVETWQWLRANLDAVIARVPSGVQGYVISNGNEFCSRGRYDEIKEELSEKFSRLGSGPRVLATTLESIALCAALKEYHGARINALFARHAGT